MQRGSCARSPCTETVIVLLGHCDRAEVGGGSAVKAEHFVELYTGMITNRFIPTVEVQLKGMLPRALI